MDTIAPRELTAHGFELLLEAVRKPGREPVDEYQRIRAKLGRYFRTYAVLDPDELADESIDRIALKLGNGEPLELSTDSYFMTVAKFVWLEHRRRKLNRSVSLDDEEVHYEPAYDPIEEAERTSERIKREIGLEAISDCKRHLSEQDLEILQTYDLGSGREKIERRNALAAKLGKSKSTLIVAISRIRSKVKECVRAKLNGLEIFG